MQNVLSATRVVICNLYRCKGSTGPVLNYLVSSVGRMPSEALQIFYVAGGGVALNYIIGAVTFSLGLVSVGKLEQRT
ncbi:DUF2523 family protein [Kingella kingae]|uniref:DUF2523 family protein n=1 Tax=Kingella kingae TaxID=504 RepID=UPI002E35F7EC|nr:DUF2523 family protein [Kingella kingae]